MLIEKYSIGIGDRFGHQGKAQLQALVLAKKKGVDITPVWNKSHREHTTLKTSPADVRREADETVRAMGWRAAYRVDADHIGMKNVDLFMDASDFFTIDVAASIGQPAGDADVRAFVKRFRRYVGPFVVPGVERRLNVAEENLSAIGAKFLLAVKEAGRIYRRIEAAKGSGAFVAEVSMDESDRPQSPLELFFILAALAEEGIPVQTIAPKFTGYFHKGVDYKGDIGAFSREFSEDLAVVGAAVKEFGLPETLKLSVHSGSDKFSIYPIIYRAIRKADAGLHLKTAGTTWLEELIGLAMAGGEGLEIAKEVYVKALSRFDEVCGPYASVLAVDRSRLPPAETVGGWSGERFARALRHDPKCPDYNPDFRQLLHVGYKVAGEMGARYLRALDTFADTIARQVTENLYDRHIKRVFLGEG